MPRRIMTPLLIAAALVLAGVPAVIFGDTRGDEPDLECVKPGETPSAYHDKDQDKCVISQKSFDKWSAWYSQAQPVRAIGFVSAALGVLLALGAGITIGVTSKTHKKRR